MSAPTRITHLVRAVSLATALACVPTALAAAQATPAPKPFEIGDSCTILTEAQIGKAFGDPVANLNFFPLGKFSCTYWVQGGPDFPKGGQLETFQLFPGLPLGFDAARDAFEDQRAVDVLSDAKIKDVNDLGVEAYLDSTNGSLVVLATNKYAFKLRWSDYDRVDELEKRDAKQLIALARVVLKRLSR